MDIQKYLGFLGSQASHGYIHGYACIFFNWWWFWMNLGVGSRMSYQSVNHYNELSISLEAALSIKKSVQWKIRFYVAGCWLPTSPGRASQAGLTTTPGLGRPGRNRNFYQNFIFALEPDGRIRRKKLHTPHRSPQNRFFENLYKSIFPS